MLDLFASEADDLYQRYSGREDERLHDELNHFVQLYFAAGVSMLES